MAGKRLPPWRDRMLLLRIAVCFSLLAAAGLIGFVSYYFLHEFQHSMQQDQFSAVAKKIESSTQQSMRRKLDALQTIAGTASFLFPNASTWPYHAIPIPYWNTLTLPLVRMASARAVSLAPILTPEEVPAFEQFAYQWLAESGYPELGISGFGKGIYAVNASTGERYHDVNGSFGVSHGQNRILTVIIEISNLTRNGAAVMYNQYSDIHRIDAIDHTIACAARAPSNRTMRLCSTTTDVLPLVQDQPSAPASLITYPVQVGDKTVAIVFSSHSWTRIFNNTINAQVTGIDMILAFGNKSYYTFTTKDGNVSYAGPGDRHDSKYDARRYSFQTTPYGGPEVFFVHIYPSDSWVAQYEDALPAIFCGVMVGIIALTSALFFFYDYLMNRAAHENELVLSTKRQFVRYISHEIRTPLNIVQLGFKLLYSKIFAFHANCSASAATTSSAPAPAPVSEPGSESAPAPALTPEPVKADTLDAALTDWMDIVTDIADSADVAITVLNDLINFDKLHMGTLQLETEPLFIWDFIAPAVHPFLIQARHAGLKLTTALQVQDASLRPEDKYAMSKQIVFGDSNKLGQVIRNLVSNALKFTPREGEVRIQAHWEPEGLPGVVLPDVNTNAYQRCGSFVLAVVDNGAGMSAQNLRALFQEGVQFQANQLQAGQGSGLGLWIAKGIVTMHQGTLTAASPGEHLGSTFTLELPVFRSLEPSPPSATDIESQPDGAVAANGKARSDSLPVGPSLLNEMVQESSKIHSILVTDDSALNRKMLCRLLRSAGYVCYEAYDGQDCVDTVMQASQGQHDAIDVILMDYEMPRMNGPTATEVLRSLGCRLPIIGITGNVLNEDREFFVTKGAVKVLSKPISLPQLREVMTELQSNGQTAADSGPSPGS